MTEAKIIADSISQQGHRLTTMEVTLHRFVLAEFNTHRWFSRNSASSRAIPVSKQITRVQSNPAYPVLWPEEQKGMQGGEAWEDPETIAGFESFWNGARDAAVDAAAGLHAAGVHKSVTNRVLEPYMWHTIIVTSTDWTNFFLQRCSPLAQPEIRLAADMMRNAYTSSVPRHLGEGQWHLPYVEDEDLKAISLTLPSFGTSVYRDVIEQAKKVSAARCARVSYLTHDGKRDIEQDLGLYDKLVSADPPHWSPLEHVATPWGANVEEAYNLYYYEDTVKRKFPTGTRRPRVGNLTGWRSLRTQAEMVDE